jgi:CubicO group peptidase (beta-lactamase class C family)
MRIAQQRVTLDSRVGDLLDSDEWRDGDRARVTIRQLLDHSSGLPARVPVWNWRTAG